MSQEARTRASRKLNEAIGITPITILVPTDKQQEYTNIAALDRAEHMEAILKSNSPERIRLLARKRSPWAHTQQNLRMLDEIEDDMRDEARTALARYREIEDELDLGDYSVDGTSALDKLKAEKVALGHRLMYYAGEGSL